MKTGSLQLSMLLAFATSFSFCADEKCPANSSIASCFLYDLSDSTSSKPPPPDSPCIPTTERLKSACTVVIDSVVNSRTINFDTSFTGIIRIEYAIFPTKDSCLGLHFVRGHDNKFRESKSCDTTAINCNINDIGDKLTISRLINADLSHAYVTVYKADSANCAGWN